MANWAGYGRAVNAGDSSGSTPQIAAMRAGNLYGDSGDGGGGGGMGARMGGDQWGGPLSRATYQGLYGAEGSGMLGAAKAAFSSPSTVENPYTTDVANEIAGKGRENVAATYSGRRRALQSAMDTGRISQGQFQSLMGELQRNESAASAEQTRDPMIEQAKSAQAFGLQQADMQARERAQMFSGYTALLNILRKPLDFQMGGAVRGGGGGAQANAGAGDFIAPAFRGGGAGLTASFADDSGTRYWNG